MPEVGYKSHRHRRAGDNRPAADALSARHEVIRVSRNGGDYRAGIASRDSIVQLF